MGPEDHKDDDATVIGMIDVKPKCRTSKMKKLGTNIHLLEIGRLLMSLASFSIPETSTTTLIID